MRSRLKWAGHVDKMGNEKLTKGLVAETMEEEDRECDGGPVLSEIWKVWEKNGEQQQQTEGVGDC